MDNHLEEDSEGGRNINNSAHTIPTSDNSPKFASTASIYFYTRQFKGDIDESIILTLRDYSDLIVQLNINDSKNSIHFVNGFREPDR